MFCCLGGIQFCHARTIHSQIWKSSNDSNDHVSSPDEILCEMRFNGDSEVVVERGLFCGDTSGQLQDSVRQNCRTLKQS